MIEFFAIAAALSVAYVAAAFGHFGKREPVVLPKPARPRDRYRR